MRSTSYLSLWNMCSLSRIESSRRHNSFTRRTPQTSNDGSLAINKQIVGMSATLSNGAELAKWLGATLHVSDFRPIPLDERIVVRMLGRAHASASVPALYTR